MRSRARRCRRPGRRTRRCPTRRTTTGPRRLRRRLPEWASESESAVSVQGRGTSRTWIPWSPSSGPVRFGPRSPTSLRGARPDRPRPEPRSIRRRPEKERLLLQGGVARDAAPFTPVDPPALIELSRHYPVDGVTTDRDGLDSQRHVPRPIRSHQDRRLRSLRPSRRCRAGSPGRAVVCTPSPCAARSADRPSARSAGRTPRWSRRTGT
jgi:hypothetical protein